MNNNNYNNNNMENWAVSAMCQKPRLLLYISYQLNIYLAERYYSVANLQDLIPTLTSKFVLPIIIGAKVGIKSCRFATECVSFMHVWMQLANQLELCLHEQTQIVASAACRVGSQEFHSWIASLPLVSLLFIVIPTSFLNF